MNRPAVPVEFDELVRAAGAERIRGEADLAIHDVQYDSRLVGPGSLFVALRGGYADGHDYLEDARSRGAVAALVEEPESAIQFSGVAVAKNTRAALSPLAARFFGYPGNSLGIIGVTGTDGKTSTGYLIDAMLRANGFRTGLVGTIAIRIGDRLVAHDTRQTTPESLEIHRLLADMRDDDVEWAVLEATSHALALHRLDDCPFDVGVITNITREHLDFHGSIANYRQAKAKLLRRVERSTGRGRPNFAVVNQDDEGARIVGDSMTGALYWFSAANREANLFADSVKTHAGGVRFDLHSEHDHTTVNLKLIGSYNVFNAMAAAGVGLGIGLDLEAIRTGLESLDHVPGRMQRVDQGQPFNVIVDYAHSPASLREALTLVRSFTNGRVIVVSGSAGERDRGKRPEQGRICAEFADFSVFSSEDPRFEDPDAIIREIAEGAEAAGGVSGVDFAEIENRASAIRTAIQAAGPGDTVLLAGKGHETCMIYDDQRTPWNEEMEASRALAELGFESINQESEGRE
jgi:UDP-N-acetylmuramoyl-L-alanyl-D-glutamate--2,6-diaminopimelate ligase